MKDIEQQIEQMHQAGRQRLEHDCTPTEKTLPHLGRSSRPLLRYAAILAAVAVVAALLLLPSRREQSTPVLAQNELPQTVKQQLQETLNQSNIQTTKHSDYAYTETTDGVRVYCEDNCNPDEVLDRMKQVIKTLQ
jgi:flagellar biosynthesis/type III secretory pathway M-ring protein FliF/YscJ